MKERVRKSGAPRSSGLRRCCLGHQPNSQGQHRGAQGPQTKTLSLEAGRRVSEQTCLRHSARGTSETRKNNCLKRENAGEKVLLQSFLSPPPSHTEPKNQRTKTLQYPDGIWMEAGIYMNSVTGSMAKRVQLDCVRPTLRESSLPESP